VRRLRPEQVRSYLELLDVQELPADPLERLRVLQWAHLARVPFENLDHFLPRQTPLRVQALFRKVVGRHRGGICYELNLLFGALLRSLGHRVRLLSARVCLGPGRLSKPFDHLALLVDGRWLVDVGFDPSVSAPLEVRRGARAVHGRGTQRLVRQAGEWLVCTRDLRGSLSYAYRFSTRRRTLREFLPQRRFHRVGPGSPFSSSWVWGVATPEGSNMLRGGRLVVEVRGRETERPVRSVAHAARLLASMGKRGPPSLWRLRRPPGAAPRQR